MTLPCPRNKSQGWDSPGTWGQQEMTLPCPSSPVLHTLFVWYHCWIVFLSGMKTAFIIIIMYLFMCHFSKLEHVACHKAKNKVQSKQMFVSIHTYTHMHAHTCTHTHTHTCMHARVHTHTYTYTHTHACMHAHTRVRVHIHKHAHTHAHTLFVLIMTPNAQYQRGCFWNKMFWI